MCSVAWIVTLLAVTTEIVTKVHFNDVCFKMSAKKKKCSIQNIRMEGSLKKKGCFQ